MRRPKAPPGPWRSQAGAFAHRVPQGDVERRDCHHGDAATPVGQTRAPQVTPDRLDCGRVLADHARNECVFQARRDGPRGRRERMQIPHADDVALGLDLEDEQVAHGAERVPFEPWAARRQKRKDGACTSRSCTIRPPSSVACLDRPAIRPHGPPAMDARVATDRAAGGQVESTYAWLRLAASTAIGTVGCVGMWSYVVALPAVQADLGGTRAEVSLPFTASMLGFGVGCVLLGRVVDRFGIMVPIAAAAVLMGLGYIAVGQSANLWQLALAHAALIGFGSSAAFGPLVADLSPWFSRRRGLAVAICSCGNYLSGVIWPPIIQHFIATDGWRTAHVYMGLVCIAVILPLTLVLRRPAPMEMRIADGAAAREAREAVGLSPGALRSEERRVGKECRS